MDITDPAIQSAAQAATGAGAGSTTTLQAGSAPTISSDVAAFANSMQVAAAQQAGTAETLMKSVLQPLSQIDAEALSLSEYAQSAIDSGNELTPSEIVMLTARSQEFLFYSQLTASIANRSADGLQQLFRQQS